MGCTVFRATPSSTPMGQRILRVSRVTSTMNVGQVGIFASTILMERPVVLHVRPIRRVAQSIGVLELPMIQSCFICQSNVSEGIISANKVLLISIDADPWCVSCDCNSLTSKNRICVNADLMIARKKSVSGFVNCLLCECVDARV